MLVVSWPVARYIVTVRLDWGATGNGTGSETICAPIGTVTDDRPSNVSGRVVPGRIPLTPALPSIGSAIAAAVIGSAEPPKAFENRSRTSLPPSDTWTVWRSVLSTRTRSAWV